jgi:hypothetical protein
MDAETLLQLAKDDRAWLRKSRELRRSADVLWDAFLAGTVEWGAHHLDDAPRADDAWERATGHLISAQMLYGLALETAFKAAILRNTPSGITIETTIDGSGKVLSAKVAQWGVPTGAGHDLLRLAEKAGVFARGKGEIFGVQSDYEAVRAILEQLGDIVVWIGRYPFPLRSGQSRKMSPDVPASTFGHYLRDWTDRLLDHFQT